MKQPAKDTPPPGINYADIITSLNKIKCEIHNREAVTVINDTQGPIFLNCCCPAFEELLYQRYYKEIDKQLSDNE
jgi:hypothetical protein